MNALNYVVLLGKVVRMERLATDEEKKYSALASDTVGMEALIVKVFDEGDDVVLVGDYGMGFNITPENADKWKFAVWLNQDWCRDMPL